MKNRNLILGLLLIVLVGNGQSQILTTGPGLLPGSDKASEAEKKAINLMRPVDFCQQIIEKVNFPESLSSEAKTLFRLDLEKSIHGDRVKLMRQFLKGTISYTGAIHFTDSIKNEYITRYNSMGVRQWKKLSATLEHGHERDHGHTHTTPTRAPGSPCLNPDFETCDFTDWDMFTGTVPYPSAAPFSFGTPVSTSSFSSVSASTPVMSGSAYDEHYICTGGTDGIGGFPLVYPGGTCSAAIGDFTMTGNGASQIKKTFLVSTGDAILTLNYAVCLQDAGHTPNEQPYFRMRVYDAAGASISCAEYEAVAGDGQPGWVVTGGWQYKAWTTVFIPLAPYVGQNVTVEFTVGDCAQGGHAGYAYVDASCDAMLFDMSAAAVCSGTPITIDAPAGASSYLWSTGATTPSITVATGGTYSVVVTPITGSACAITLDTTVFANPNPIAAFTDDAPQCSGIPINFTDNSNPNGGTLGTWAWDFGDGATSSLQNPSHTFAGAGTYTVTLTVTTTDGCSHTTTSTVTINPGGSPTINPAGPFCNTAAPATITSATPGGTWSATCGTCIDATTGVFDPSLAAIGANTITYTVTGACAGTDTEVLNVQEVTLDNVVSTDVVCFGDNNGTITITATGATQFSINAGGSFQAGGNFTGLGPNTYNILVQNALGCQATGTATILEPTQVTAAAGFQDESCFGACDGFVVVAPGGGISPYTIAWTGPLGPLGSSALVTDVCVGAYTVIVTDNNGCPANAATNVGGPSQVIITAINTTPEQCPGDCQGSITITASGGTGGYTYSTDGGTAFQPANAFINVCTGAYNVVVQDNTGCTATGITNITAPNPIVVTASPDVTVCIGQNASISANSVGGTGGINFSWDNGLGAGASHLVDPPGTTTYAVTGTDANGCTDTDSVTVFENPPLNVIAYSDTSVCPGFSATLTAFASGGNGGPYTYTWSNNVDASVLAGQTISVTPTTQTIWTVVAADNCGTPVATDDVTVSLFALPAVTYTVDNTQGCTPVVVNFNNTTNPALTGSCFWDYGNGATSTNCADGYTFTTPGCYTISLTVTTVDGCIVDTSIVNQICVWPYPVADFSFGPIPADVFNTEIDFTNLTIGGSTYTWDFAGLGASTAINPSFTFPPDNGGVYPVCLTTVNEYGCMDTACHDVVIGGEFLLYVPNAFTSDGDGVNDVFHPVLQGEVENTYELFIFNRWGTLIFYSNNKAIGWNGLHNDMMSKEDVYVWKIRVKSSLDGENKVFMGHVTLLK
ncbi:MAG TPA: PKD domain-containing protein [Flavobacteriales bacterium]|nr:PKD domain-containing protein [Flavobacteriales bacterium]